MANDDDFERANRAVMTSLRVLEAQRLLIAKLCGTGENSAIERQRLKLLRSELSRFAKERNRIIIEIKKENRLPPRAKEEEGPPTTPDLQRESDEESEGKKSDVGARGRRESSRAMRGRNATTCTECGRKAGWTRAAERPKRNSIAAPKRARSRSVPK